MKLRYLLVFAAVASGCASVPVPTNVEALTVYSVEPASARADADAAARRGDFRLMGLQGYSLDVPGTDLPFDLVQREYGLRIIKGGTDAYRNDEERRINEDAYEYATEYNRRILELRPRADH